MSESPARADLFAIDPRDLTAARQLCHNACQWPSKAARANLTARQDDSHSALLWSSEHGALVSQPLDRAQTARLGFRFGDRTLVWIADTGVETRYELAGTTNADIGGWVDATLAAAGLARATGVSMPYVLDPVDYDALCDEAEAVSALGAWYRESDTALTAVVERFGHLAVGNVVVRCWPHHFDIAALFTLEDGDPKTARSIGVGLSPGDETFQEPYVYCTPWPAPDELPDAPAKMTWHTEGFTALVCPASRITAGDDVTAIFEDSVAYLFDHERSLWSR